MQNEQKVTTLLLDAPAGVLEVVYHPVEQAIYPRTAVICHPHPLHGGTMNNKVVITLERAFIDKKISVVRFNFRGVGKSAGEYDGGKGELDDLYTIIQWIKKTQNNPSLILAGFSFGAYIAAQAALRYTPELLLSVAPAVHHQDYEHVASLTCPWIVVQGEQDEIVPPEQVFSWVASLPRDINLISFPQTGHFFHGQLLHLRQQLEVALTQYIP
jgi:uncharacterized protein